ncbi:FHA domain-containing protein [Pseudoxanthomonas suwonensis]|uniref:Signal peptide protein n=1 Tax=Pseudoxanthomonas suwonensis TaxID=314722 RepID=A0A0E3Z571_9GAMM|nr:FHA domain-containing protein [Pseudoxanthomonas suwonensis]AKC87842.1 signal peptide protein [Pseudoxanthomonas suwonensis]
MSDLQLHFAQRQQADHPLSPGVHRVVRQPNGALGIGDALPGVLLLQFCLDRRGLWLQVPPGARGVHVNGRPVQRMALLRAGDAVYVDGVELLVRAPLRPRPAPLDPGEHAGDPRVVLRGVGGQHHGRSFTLGPPRLVGTSREADIRIDDPAFPARHALLERHGDVVLLRGLGQESSVVNGVAVRDAVLGVGDQVVFDGQHRFVVEFPAAPADVPSQATVPAAETEPVAAVSDDGPARPRARLPWLLLAALLLGLVFSALLWFGAR